MVGAATHAGRGGSDGKTVGIPISFTQDTSAPVCKSAEGGIEQMFHLLFRIAPVANERLSTAGWCIRARGSQGGRVMMFRYIS